MQMTQNYLKDSDEEFSVLINEENNVKYLKKKLKSHLALTSYILFRKK
jgi:hypothetical protein